MMISFLFCGWDENEKGLTRVDADQPVMIVESVFELWVNVPGQDGMATKP